MAVYRLKPGHARTFLLGVARRQGEDVRIDDPRALDKTERETLAEHFEHAGAAAEPKATAQRATPTVLRNGLSEEQARAKLNNAGITFAEDVAGDALADLFDQAFGGAAGGAERGSTPPPLFGDADGASGPEKKTGRQK